MIDPKLEICPGDYISIRGSDNFYRVVDIIDAGFPDPPNYFDYIIDMNSGVNSGLSYKMVSRSLIKGVISKEAMLQKQNAALNWR